MMALLKISEPEVRSRLNRADHAFPSLDKMPVSIADTACMRQGVEADSHINDVSVAQSILMRHPVRPPELVSKLITSPILMVTFYGSSVYTPSTVTTG